VGKIQSFNVTVDGVYS